MIVDLTYCDLRYESNQDPDTLASNNDQTRITRLTKENWVIVLAVEGPQITSSDLNHSHVDPEIHKRIKLHDDTDIWMVLLSVLVGSCFVVYNKNHCEKN